MKKNPVSTGVVLGIGVVISICLLISALFYAHIAGGTASVILPRVAVGSIPLGGQSREEAEKTLEAQSARLLARTLTFRTEKGEEATITLRDIGVHLDVPATAKAAAAYGRTGNLFDEIHQTLRGMFGVSLPLHFTLEKNVFEKTLIGHFAHMETAPKNATWTVDADARLTLVPAEEGDVLDIVKARTDVSNRLTVHRQEPILLHTISSQAPLSIEEAQGMRRAVMNAAQRPLVLTFRGQTWDVPLRTMRPWLELHENEAGNPVVSLRASDVASYLETILAPHVLLPAQNAAVAAGDDGSVHVIGEARAGTTLNVHESVVRMQQAVVGGQDRIELATQPLPALLATNADLSRYGIHTLLSEGVTDFVGSPKNRMHNITVGAARFNSILIAPNETFAFNEHLGPVTKDMGYLPELVILTNVTKPEYGGGLCQVSTTAFRAAVLLGLPVSERSNHAYPVAYYGTPGFDATIYPNQRTWKDGTDLQFLNDTPASILVQTRIEGTKLIFDFFGTSDTRTVQLDGPHIYDKKPDGSLKATLTVRVEKNGEQTRTQTFASAYKSPALFPHARTANAETETWEQKVQRIAEKDRKAQEAFLAQQKTAAQQKARQAAKASPTPQP